MSHSFCIFSLIFHYVCLSLFHFICLSPSFSLFLSLIWGMLKHIFLSLLHVIFFHFHLLFSILEHSDRCWPNKKKNIGTDLKEASSKLNQIFFFFSLFDKVDWALARNRRLNFQERVKGKKCKLVICDASKTILKISMYIDKMWEFYIILSYVEPLMAFKLI